MSLIKSGIVYLDVITPFLKAFFSEIYRIDAGELECRLFLTVRQQF